ncbi:MAG TPA: cytochrome c-type biogenesis protein [Gammaproteobacteria bacterium]
MIRAVLIFFALLLSVVCAAAKEATPMAEDPETEARLIKLSSDMRCLVCQNQSLADSDSDFANDLRREMRVMMKQGKTDAEIVDFMVQRFGDFVLFRPPMKMTTALLWFGPFLLLVIGGGALIITLKRRRGRVDETPLSDQDIRRAEQLLDSQAGEEHKP